MPLGTTWSDIGRLLLYAALCAFSFLGSAVIHWFVVPRLQVSPFAKNMINALLLVFLAVVVHRVWGAAIRQAMQEREREPEFKPARPVCGPDCR